MTHQLTSKASIITLDFALRQREEMGESVEREMETGTDRTESGGNFFFGVAPLTAFPSKASVSPQ